jgi:hypothetical protein
MYISENGVINFTTEEGDPVNVRVSKVKALASAGADVEKRVKPGDEMPDGTIYVGLSPDTGRPLYTTKVDQGKFSWVDAEYAVEECRGAGGDDWRLPSINELELLYKKRNMGALEGSFDAEGEYYWSSDEDLNFLSKVKRFNDGARGHSFKKMDRMLRCVKSDESVAATGSYKLKADEHQQVLKHVDKQKTPARAAAKPASVEKEPV